MVKRVMIIADDIVTLKHLSLIVKSMFQNVEVRTFSTMENVYETAMQNKIDLFIVDIIIEKSKPGDTSGIRFVDKIRTVPEYEFTPVVFITSLEDPKLYAYSELHSFCYIEKPYDTEYVKRVVRKAMKFPDIISGDNTLFFLKDGVLYSVKISEILYAESIGHKIHFHRTDGVTLVIPYKTCRQIIEEADSASLVQCSRNLIVNRDYIENVDITNRCIKVKGLGRPLGIGVTYQKRLCREFANNLSL